MTKGVEANPWKRDMWQKEESNTQVQRRSARVCLIHINLWPYILETNVPLFCDFLLLFYCIECSKLSVHLFYLIPFIDNSPEGSFLKLVVYSQVKHVQCHVCMRFEIELEHQVHRK